MAMVDRVSLPYSDERKPPPCSVASSCPSEAGLPDPNKVVVVTRARGFTNTHILRELICQGYTVRGTFDGQMDSPDDINTLFDLDPICYERLFLYEVDIFKTNVWNEVMNGAKYVIHMTMPRTTKDPKTEDDFIMPAVVGTRNVINAAIEAKSVKRIVLVTSIATIAWSKENANNQIPYTEKNWEDESKLSGFGKSQLLCEKLAWKTIDNLTESDKLELVVLNPAYIFGPMLHGMSCSSMAIVKRLLEDRSLLIPNVNIPIVDVRDVASAVVKSLTEDKAVGHRHVLYSRSVWLSDIAKILFNEFSGQGYNISQKVSSGHRFCTLPFHRHKDLDQYKPFENSVFLFDNRRMRRVLKIEPRHLEETIVETAYSLIYWGLIRKPNSFRLCGKAELD